MTPDPREHRRPLPDDVETTDAPHPDNWRHLPVTRWDHGLGTAEIDRHTGRPLPVTVLDPDPLTYVEPEMEDPRFAMDDWTAPEPSSSPGTAVWIVAAGLVGLTLVVGIAGYLASRS